MGNCNCVSTQSERHIHPINMDKKLNKHKEIENHSLRREIVEMKQDLEEAHSHNHYEINLNDMNASITTSNNLDKQIKWQYKDPYYRWVNFNNDISKQIEQLKISRILKIKDGEIIRRASIDQATQTITCKYDIIQRECRRIEIDPCYGVLNRLQSEQETLKQTQNAYQHQLDDINQQISHTQNKLEQKQADIIKQQQELSQMKAKLNELKHTKEKMCGDLPDFDGLDLGSNEKLKLLQLKALINDDNDELLTVYLKQTNWNISTAVEQYYHEKLGCEHQWEWKNDDDEWVPYIQQRSKQFDVVRNTEDYMFRISGHDYRFYKVSMNKGYQWDVVRKYKVVDTYKIKENYGKKWRYRLNRFEKHMTLNIARKLKVGDKIDHMDKRGKFCKAVVIGKTEDGLKVHYEGRSVDDDVISDYKTELRRFAKRGSISGRPAHRLKELKKGDFVNVNPMGRHPEIGWQCCKIQQMDKQSGQIQVCYQRYVLLFVIVIFDLFV